MIRKLLGRLVPALLAAVTLLCAAVPAAADGEKPALSLTGEEQAYLERSGPLKVGFVQDRIPVSFSDGSGQLAGISRYIFDRLADLSGLQFEYVPLPAGDVTYDYLLGEGFDLVTSVEYNQENKKARGILISEPYLTSRKVVVARNDLEFSYSANLKVAISTGSQTIRKVLGSAYPNFELADYSSIMDCFDAVRSGQADMMIQNQYVAEYWFSKPAYEELKVIPVLGMDDQLCFSAVVPFDPETGLPQAGDGQILIDILDKAIAQLTEDEVGTYTIQAIMENQYSLTLGDFLYRYRYPAIALGASALVILILALLLLRQRVLSAEERANAKVKGEFLSTMSHEIRTPLNGLVGLNYLMSQRLDDPDRLAGYLRQSTTTAKYLLGLVNDILDMSRIQDDRIDISHAPMDLKLLTDTVVSVVRGSMAEKGLTFDTDISLPWPCVEGDEFRVQQVLLNLLDNARKFTPAGGKVTLHVAQTEMPSGVILTRAEVSDTGRGMSEEFQKKVFHSFARELDTVSKGNQGTGLGLPISLNLARLMGGDLSFTSRKGEGSDFVFTFPAQRAVMPADSGDAGQPAGKDGRQVLVAEDNELNGEILMDLLTDEGYRAVWAKNGREALDAFSSSPMGTYKVILMDLLMPEMDGFQAAAAIRALDRPDAGTVRIVACTANSSDEDREKAASCGMDGFLAKPIDIDTLIQTLSAL